MCKQIVCGGVLALSAIYIFGNSSAHSVIPLYIHYLIAGHKRNLEFFPAIFNDTTLALILQNSHHYTIFHCSEWHLNVIYQIPQEVLLVLWLY